MKIIKGRKNVRKLVFSELPNGSISFEAQYKSMKGYFHPVIVILEKKDLERAEEMRR